MLRKKKHISSPLDELMALVNEYGTKEIFIALEDIFFIRASNEFIKGNKAQAKKWKRVANRIRKIKVK